MSAVYKFKSLDWVKNIVQTNHNLKKMHVDPTAAFDFEDDFSVGTIHGKNNAIPTRKVGTDMTAVIEVANDDEVSLISSKTQDGLVAAAGPWVATGSTPPVVGLTTDATPAGVTGTAPVAVVGPMIPSNTGPDGSVDGRPGGK